MTAVTSTHGVRTFAMRAGTAHAVLTAGFVVALGLNSGGYYPTGWGWATLALVVVAGVTTVLRRNVALDRRRRAFLVAGGAWLAVVAAEATRHGAATTGAHEVERGLLYLMIVGVVLLTIRRGSIEACTAGALGGITLIELIGIYDYLWPQAAPDPFEGRLLFRPIGYANAQGILATIGVLLAIGFVLRGHRAAAALLVPLGVALALTQSRGAFASLAIGVAILAFERRAVLTWCSPFLLVGLALVSGGDRPAYWRAAMHDVRDHPFLGSGPGTFGAAWLHYRDVPHMAVDAHNLYLQTLAELGPLGLLALVAFLGAPVLLAHVESPVERAAFAAYAAFLAHAAIDWDWQLPVVTGTALLLGSLLLVGRTTTRSNAAAAAVLAVAALIAAATLAGNVALERATSAAADGHWATATRLATQARRWQPWSSEPLLVLGTRASFERATELAPNDWRGWYDLMLASNGAEQRRALQKLAVLDPLGPRRAP
jgi:hypothetical protein